MTPTLSLEAIVTAIACLCSTTDVRENQVSNLFYGHNTTIPHNSFWQQKDELASIKQRINSMEAKIDRIYEMLQSQLDNKQSTPKVDRDCDSVGLAVELEQIISYEIPNVTPFMALCKNVETYGNWLVIQRRKDGIENFYRNWAEYEAGFGRLDADFFIGLKNLHHITKAKPHELLIRMKTDLGGEYRIAIYDHFEIDSDTQGYALKKLGTYSGTAGDSLRGHVGYRFSTYDRDNDIDLTQNCAETYHGAWWFKKCLTVHLNGRYMPSEKSTLSGEGLVWFDVTDYRLSLVLVEVFIRPKPS